MRRGVGLELLCAPTFLSTILAARIPSCDLDRLQSPRTDLVRYTRHRAPPHWSVQAAMKPMPMPPEGTPPRAGAGPTSPSPSSARWRILAHERVGGIVVRRESQTRRSGFVVPRDIQRDIERYFYTLLVGVDVLVHERLPWCDHRSSSISASPSASSRLRLPTAAPPSLALGVRETMAMMVGNSTSDWRPVAPTTDHLPGSGLPIRSTVGARYGWRGSP